MTKVKDDMLEERGVYMIIYCPLCRCKVGQEHKMDNELEQHILEGYRIDCLNCGLYAYIEDVSIVSKDNKKEKETLG